MKLRDAASVVRSKNAGPLKLTIDLMFPDRATYERATSSFSLTPAALAKLYDQPVQSIRIVPYPVALALKIIFDRRIVAGSPGDTDVYGAQQHAPLLEVEI
jgi:hypothetical protein